MTKTPNRILATIALPALAVAMAAPAVAQEAPPAAQHTMRPGMSMGTPPSDAPPADDREQLLDRISQLEQRLADLETRLGAVGNGANGAEAATPAQIAAAQDLEARVASLEENVVLSEPETTVKRVDVWVDANGTQYDQPVEGAEQRTTYQRFTSSRRQAISEEIEEAMADAEENTVRLGMNSALTLQNAQQLTGPASPADGHSYALASADIYFTAGIAQNTMFFANVVGLSGNSPDPEIGGLTLLNAYTARLSRQNELNLREAWIKTQLFGQRVEVTAGRLDLTNYFDNNVAANDETTQFLSDALVNNQALGLTSNGPGVVLAYQPYSSFGFRVGVQQSDALATNLSNSIYTLAEVSYLARPFGLPEGNYRAWFRNDNSTGSDSQAWGVSIDQRLTSSVVLFGRYGSGDVGLNRVRFYSGGLSFNSKLVLNPEDRWGLGYARTEIGLAEEDLAEIFYNLHLTERLRLTGHLQYVRGNDGEDTRSFVLPGFRLQAEF